MIRQSILENNYRYCEALACPYLAPGGPSLPARGAVDNVLLRRTIAEGLTHVPWGPDVVECDLRAAALSGDAIDGLLGPEFLQDATLLVLRMDPQSLADEGIRSALKRLPLSSMLSVRLVMEFGLEAFSSKTWRTLLRAVDTVHEIRLIVSPDCPFPDGTHSALRFARQLRRSGGLARLALRCPLKLDELAALTKLLSQREALCIDHIEVVTGHPHSTSSQALIDDALRATLADSASAAWRHDPCIALGPLQALLALSELGRTWEDWAAALQLDSAQQEVVLALVNELKEEVARLFDAPPPNGKASPVAHLQTLSRQDLTKAEERKAFDQYLGATASPSGEASYQAAQMAMEARCRKKIAALLRPEQATTFQALSARSLLELDTGIDPLGDRVHRGADHRIPFDSWASQYNLAAPAKQEARRAIETWRTTFARIMGTPPEHGGTSPAAFLAELMHTTPETAQARFIAYTQRIRLQGEARSYFAAAESAKQLCLKELVAIIGGDIKPAALSEALDTIDIGHDPFGALLRQLGKAQDNNCRNTEAP